MGSSARSKRREGTPSWALIVFRLEVGSFCFPSTEMAKGPIIVTVAAALWLAVGTSVRAQIVPIDEHGTVVFINLHKGKPSPNGPSTKTRRIVLGGNRLHATPAPSLSPAPAPNRLEHIVSQAAEQNRVDPALVKAVIGVESGWNPRAISRKGAVGLMQLIPTTAERFGVANPFDPEQNVSGGTRYLRTLLDRYNGDLTKTLAAYNAGESAVERFRGVPAYPETQSYVQKVTDAYFQPGSGSRSAAGEPPHRPIRRTVDDRGRVVYTNE